MCSCCAARVMFISSYTAMNMRMCLIVIGRRSSLRQLGRKAYLMRYLLWVYDTILLISMQQQPHVSRCFRPGASSVCRMPGAAALATWPPCAYRADPTLRRPDDTPPQMLHRHLLYISLGAAPPSTLRRHRRYAATDATPPPTLHHPRRCAAPTLRRPGTTPCRRLPMASYTQYDIDPMK